MFFIFGNFCNNTTNSCSLSFIYIYYKTKLLYTYISYITSRVYYSYHRADIELVTNVVRSGNECVATLSLGHLLNTGRSWGSMFKEELTAATDMRYTPPRSQRQMLLIPGLLHIRRIHSSTSPAVGLPCYVFIGLFYSIQVENIVDSNSNSLVLPILGIINKTKLRKNGIIKYVNAVLQSSSIVDFLMLAYIHIYIRSRSEVEELCLAKGNFELCCDKQKMGIQRYLMSCVRGKPCKAKPRL